MTSGPLDSDEEIMSSVCYGCGRKVGSANRRRSGFCEVCESGAAICPGCGNQVTRLSSFGVCSVCDADLAAHIDRQVESAKESERNILEQAEKDGTMRVARAAARARIARRRG